MPWTHDTKQILITRGPLILSLESCFFHWQRYPRRRVAPHTPPLHETARPREIEQPYRHGHGHAFRIPLTRRGFVLGYWVPPELEVLEEEESDKLFEAVEGAMIPGITATEISAWARGRKPWFDALLERLREWWERKFRDNLPVVPGYGIEDVVVHDEVIPWDGKVYDLEDARVDLPRRDSAS